MLREASGAGKTFSVSNQKHRRNTFIKLIPLDAVALFAMFKI